MTVSERFFIDTIMLEIKFKLFDISVTSFRERFIFSNHVALKSSYIGYLKRECNLSRFIKITHPCIWFVIFPGITGQNMFSD